METESSTSPYRTAAEVAELLRTTRQTVNRWAREGSITAYRLPGKRAQLFDLAEVKAALAPVPSSVPSP